MTSWLSVAITLAIFGLTLTLILVKPRGLNEAWATCLGAGLMLLTARVGWGQAVQSVVQGGDVLLFLLGLLLLSELLRASGFFDWAAIHAARAAKGDGQALYRNVFLLGAVTTAFLSLDTTAVILTPVVLGFVGRLKLSPRPFLIACAFVANTGSLLLPVSNLTNLLFVSAFHWSFGTFALRMALPQIVALGVNYALLRGLFRRDLPERFSLDVLPAPETVLPDTPFFRGAVAVLVAVLVGYFVGSLLHVPPFAIALAGCAILAGWGVYRRKIGWSILRDISWPVFPFVVGLFIVVRGVENLGLTGLVAQGLERVETNPLALTLGSAFGAGIGSNVINNIPMALLALGGLGQGQFPPAAAYGALLGCNLGPNLTVVGSLATMLVISSARRDGVEVSARDFFHAGAKITGPVLLATALTLWLILLLLH